MAASAAHLAPRDSRLTASSRYTSGPWCGWIAGVSSDADILPDDIETLRAALAAERAARQSAEARATGAEAMIAHLKLLIAKLQRDRFGRPRSAAAGCSISWSCSSRSWRRMPPRPTSSRSRLPAPRRTQYGQGRCVGHSRRICRASAW